MTRNRFAGLAILALLALPAPARACEAAACGAEGAQMLQRAAAAVVADKARALNQFTRGEAGFRTADSYVFCIGPGAVMTAHPNKFLRGRNTSEWLDAAGQDAVAAMLQTAVPGQVSRTDFTGGSGDVLRAAFYTRAGDQVCGIGLYGTAPEPQVHAAQVRPGLGG